MNSGQDAQSDPDHTQTDTPLVHRINVMENTETKKANDGLGDYAKGNASEGVEGGAVDKQEMTTMYENVPRGENKATKDESKKDEMKKKDEGNMDAGKENKGEKNTVVIVDPNSLDSDKGDCCTRFKKFCLLNKLLVAFICLLIFFVCLFLGLYLDARSKPAKTSETPSTASTASTGVTTPGPTPGPTGVTTPGPTPGPTVAPTPGAVMQGIFTTSENYTTTLEDPTSLAYKKFENKFIAAVMYFYAQNHPEYIAYYEDTQVTDFEKSGKQAVVHFEVHFSQLDNDSSLPDAHTVLLDQVNVQHRLDPFSIITVTLTKT